MSNPKLDRIRHWNGAPEITFTERKTYRASAPKHQWVVGAVDDHNRYGLGRLFIHDYRVNHGTGYGRNGCNLICYLAGQPEGHLGSVGDAGDIDPFAVNTKFLIQLVNQCRDKSDIVNPLFMGAGDGLGPAVIPVFLYAVRTDHDEAILVGQRIQTAEGKINHPL